MPIAEFGVTAKDTVFRERGPDGFSEQPFRAYFRMPPSPPLLPPPTIVTPPAPLSKAIGRSRYIVLLAVLAVLLVSISLFLQGTVLAVESVYTSWKDLIGGHSQHSHLILAFLEIVSIMLEAVVFYLVGVGLYSLFISPMNVTAALGVETLSDLEERVISVIIAILAINFLEHFIQWDKPLATLEFGLAMAVVVGALVAFQAFSHRATVEQKVHNSDVQARAQRELFHEDNEQRVITLDSVEAAPPTPAAE